ncbi:MoaD/ThiS family protein [Crocinitomix catalasitica]|uniref:MoaD/ThiS family protein n=1 Tax=Crocinitomix catalasitica TaxID=184607 RepID=UPI000480B568|nr:MoaD/ThiS family protein [Crocinitomix catalasitica]
MMYKVKYFGRIAELIGSSEENFEGENIITIADFQNKLIEKYDLLANEKFSIAVDMKIMELTTFLNDANEIAILPPFAGG